MSRPALEPTRDATPRAVEENRIAPQPRRDLGVEREAAFFG
jgi:hypothetical protein